MERLCTEQQDVWVDSFAPITPPDYISNHPEGPRRKAMLEEWQGSRRGKAIDSLKNFLSLFPHAASIDEIISELEKNSLPGNIKLAVKIKSSISNVQDLCLASELADALVDPVSRSSILAKACQDNLSRLGAMQQRIRVLEGRMNGARSGLFASVAILFFLMTVGFSQDTYELTMDSPHPEVVRKSWWGLHVQRLPLRWMAFDTYDETHQEWCVQNERGDWYPLFMDDMRFDDY